jgi:hypothetical protein
MGIKIQDITSKSAKIASTDLIEIAQISGATYISRKVTGAEINELSLDTSPQLGGNLDVNGNSIVSTSNGNINITPNGTGDILLNADSIRVGDSNVDATIASNGTGDLILTTNQGAASQGVIRIYDGSNANIELTPHGRGAVVISIKIETKSVAYTLVLDDNCKMIEMNSAGAVNLTIPTNAAQAFPNGSQILIAQYGAGQVTIIPDTGVTMRSNGGKNKLSGQYSMATLIKRGADEWYLSGDITT